MKNVNLIEISKNEKYKQTDAGKSIDTLASQNEIVDSVSEKKPAKDSEMQYATLSAGGTDAINLYLKELREYPLLTREEEIHYGRLSLKGDEESRKKMIVCNLRLVFKIARNYFYTGIDLLDLVEEGNLGLMRAVDKYDPERGFRFSTYATWWIRQNIERAIMNQRHAVRLPIHIQKEYNSFKKRMREESLEFNHAASADEISELFSSPIDRVRQVIEWNERSFFSTSQDDKGDDHNVVEFFPDDGKSDPAYVLEMADEKSRLDLVQEKINDRDREILIRRFGLDGSKPSTLGEIGSAFGISRERVRQIIQEVIIKMRKEYSAAEPQDS